MLAWLNESVRGAMPEYMNVHHYEYQSEFARKYYEEGLEAGRRQGRREGRQKVLARLLNLRFGKLPDWTLERLQSADRFARPSESAQLRAGQGATRELGRSQCQ